MRIHIQNQPGDIIPPIDGALWAQAATRAGRSPSGDTVSIGSRPEELAAALREAEVVIASGATLAAAAPLRAPRLQLIYLTSAGVDMLEGVELPPDAILLNNRGVHADKAGEYGLMAVLMLANHVPMFVTNQMNQIWSRRLGSTMAGRRATIIGLGSLGSGIARRLRWLGMHIVGVRASTQPHPDCDQVVTAGGLHQVLPATEFLVLACPLTAETRGILGRSTIALLPGGAGVVNLGRGELIEQEALLDALDTGHLSGAVLDVFVPEPVPLGHRLWHTPNLIITPHMAAADPATYQALSLETFFTDLQAWETGRPLANRVNLARGY